MRKLIVTCVCGQRMQVPRSAYGKVGICPKCGQKSKIGSTNTEPMPLPAPDDQSRLLEYDHAAEGAKQRFGHAVDLFYKQRYAESLALLDELVAQYPGNEEIATARIRCIEKSPASNVFNEDDAANALEPAVLDAESVKSTLHRLMTHGGSDLVRLRAAELACRILNLLPRTHDAPATLHAPTANQETTDM